MSTLYEELKNSLEHQQSIALATVIRGPAYVGSKLLMHMDTTTQGTLGHPQLDQQVVTEMKQALWQNTPRLQTYHFIQEGEEQRFDIFIEGFPPAPELIIIGAGHIAIALATIAKTVQYHVTLIDARSAFATHDRFPDVDELIIGWPDEVLASRQLTPATAIAVLTHDEKFDDPTLRYLLKQPVGYIGAIGSRKTSQERRERLQQAGFTDEQLDRIHGPIGLAIGAQTPAEIALAIMAEILATRQKKSGNVMNPGFF